MRYLTKSIAAALVLLACASAAGAQTPAKAQAMVCGGGDASQGTSVQAKFGSSVTSGNLLIAIIRNGDDTLLGVADSLGTSYSEAVQNSSTETEVWIYYGIAGSSGSNTVTATFSSTNYVWVCVIEVENIDSMDPLEDTALGDTFGVTDMTASALDTAAANAYVVCGASQNNFHTYTAGTDFTLLDGTIPTNPSNFGGVEEYIPGSTLKSYTAHITSNGTASGNVACAAFNAGEGGEEPSGPPLGTLNLLGVGR